MFQVRVQAVCKELEDEPDGSADFPAREHPSPETDLLLSGLFFKVSRGTADIMDGK